MALSVLEIAVMRMPRAVIARLLPVPIHAKSPILIFLAMFVQRGIWLAIVIGVGLTVAHKLGLGAPVLQAWLRGEPVRHRLRGSLVPIAITIAILVGASGLAGASWFHPRRHQNPAAFADEFLNSPGAEQAFKELDELGLGAVGPPLTAFSEVVWDLEQAFAGEVNGRLFEVSVLILLFVQILPKESALPKWQVACIAALFVGVLHTVEGAITMHENTVLIMNVFHKYGLPNDIPPIWGAFVPIGMRVIPSAVALGLLYVYCGIEASIVASFCGTTLLHPLTIFWLNHFR